MKKKILAVLLCVAMMLSIAPIAVLADPITGTGEGGSGFQPGPSIDGPTVDNPVARINHDVMNGEYNSLSEALAAAQDGDYITIINDVDLSAEEASELYSTYYFPIDKDITLDLGGFSITGGCLDIYADVTILSYENPWGDGEGDPGIIVGETNAIWVNSGATLTLESGDIYAGADGVGIRVDDGALVMTGGSVNSNGTDEAICLTGDAEATISGGDVVGGKWGITAWNDSELTVSGTASVTAPEEGGVGISTNGNAGQNATINVEGGTVEGTDLGIYLPSGALNVSGGTIEGATGVYYKAGDLNITGGTIVGNGTAAEYSYNGNGANPTGDAIVIDSCGYPNGVGDVSISGGTFESDNAAAVGGYNTEGNDPVENVISGGSFTGATAIDEDLCANGLELVDDGNGNYGVSKIKFAEAYDANGDLVGTYDSIDAAFTAAGDGSTVKLIADVYEQQQINTQAQDITLDLNGHTIYVDGGAGLNFSMGYYWNGDHVFTIEDTVGTGGINITPKYFGNACISDNIGRTIVVNGGTYTSTGKAIYCTGSDGFTINDGTFVGDVYVHDTGYGHGVLEIDGGSFDGALTTAGDAVLEISDGEFTADPTPYLADGLVAAASNGVYSVAPAVAEIDGTPYASLEDAIAAADDGDTITIVSDFTTDATKTALADRLVIDKEVTIDFGAYTMTVPGELEPTDNWCAIYVDADATFTATTGGIYCADKANGEVGVYAINVRNGADLVIDGGNYHGGGTAIQCQLGSVTINDGTFTASAFEAPYGMDFAFNCVDAAYQNGTATISVKGGTFVGFNPANLKSEGDPTDFVADGYASFAEGNNVYTVTAHTHDYAVSYEWAVISGEKIAVFSYVCACGDELEDEEVVPEFSKSRGVVTYIAVDSLGNVATDQITETYTVTLNGDELPGVYNWGDVCTLDAGANSAWFIDGAKVADGSDTYTFAVTADTVVTTEASEVVEPVAIISASAKSPAAGKAEFNAKWSIPAGAEINSVTIYRGANSSGKTISADTLISVGSAMNVNLNALNGDYTLRLSGLSSAKYQHIVIVINYTLNGEEKVLKSDVAKILPNGSN